MAERKMPVLLSEMPPLQSNEAMAPNDGFTVYNTEHKIVLEVQHNGEHMHVPVSIDVAREFRDQFQSAISEFEHSEE